MPGLYRSTATVLVARPEMTNPSARAALTSELEARVNRISEEALSRARLEALIEKYGLYGPQGKDDEQNVMRMRRDITIEMKGIDPVQQRGTPTAFAVSYRGRNAETAAQATNSLASLDAAEDS